MTERKSYPSDLSDQEWAIVSALLPPKKQGRGRKESHSRREMLNAIFYVLRSGCAWRMMPHDLPPWTTVYTYFRKLERQGIWQQLNDALREKVREQAGRQAQPSAAVIDSQSVKTTEKGGLGA
jgi:putative transposase